jgi:acetolactate synthase I/II/III large subunit
VGRMRCESIGMRLSESIAHAFRAEGVRDIFCVLGDGNLEVVASFSSLPGCRISHFRHEAMAVAAADGYSRSRSLPAVAAVTCGPGLTNAATSLVAAARFGTPLLLFAGSSKPGHLQYLDQKSFAEACSARHIQINGTKDLTEAFEHLWSGKGPIVISADISAQQQESSPSAYLPAKGRARRPLRPPPSTFRRAAELIMRSQRPVIIAGRGALGAFNDVIQLARHTRAHLATTLLAKGAFDHDPAAIGIAGGFSHAHAERIFARSDCIIAIGTSLSTHTLAYGKLFPTTRVIHIDIAADRKRFSHAIRADAESAIPLLLKHLATGHNEAGLPDELSTPVGDDRDEYAPDLPSDALDPRAVAASLEEQLPDNAAIVVGAGHFMSFPLMYLSGRHRSFHLGFDFGAIGQALGLAVGVGLGARDRCVILIEGDASLMMNLQELDTLNRYSLPVLVIVFNDGGLGAEYHKLRSWGLDPTLAEAPCDNLRAKAESFGLPAARATTMEQVQHAVERFLVERRPQLLDIAISKTVVSRPYRQLYDAPIATGTTGR